jgi:hypothetical protein
MIQNFPEVNDPMKLKVLVHDAAANIRKAGRQDSTKVYESITCIDHLLNTSLGHAETRTELVANLLKNCKLLAARTHQSTNDWLLIKKVCKGLDIDPLKITQPVTTRWNSNCMMLESIKRMQPALEQILLEPNAKDDLKNLIPSDTEFSMINNLFKYLKMMKKYSEKWSSEKNVSIPCVLSDLFAIIKYTEDKIIRMRNIRLDNYDPVVADFLSAFVEELQMHNTHTSRLRNLGQEKQLYRIAHYLHPYYKGHAMRDVILENGQNSFECTEKYMIDKHPTTARYNKFNL